MSDRLLQPAVTFDIDNPPGPGTDAQALDLEFNGELWYWRGPSPYHFVTVPADESATLRSVSADVSYGWGMIPVWARIGQTVWETSLFPKDGRYVVPVKDAVRKAEELTAGDSVTVQLVIRH
jgi:hypothetical protein